MGNISEMPLMSQITLCLGYVPLNYKDSMAYHYSVFTCALSNSLVSITFSVLASRSLKEIMKTMS